MKLYRNVANPTEWFAFGPTIGWVTFPAEANGWQKRKPARGVDPLRIREVPIGMGFNTGIPDTLVLAVGAFDSGLTRAAIMPRTISVVDITERKAKGGVSPMNSKNRRSVSRPWEPPRPPKAQAEMP
jgi:hypothetical protein